MPSIRRATERLLLLAGRGSTWTAIAATAALLAGCWVIALTSHSPISVTRHWFYVPIVFAAIRFGAPGALASGIAAGLLGGPLVFTVADHNLLTWVYRAGFFLLVGLLVAGLVAIVRDSLVVQLEASERARELSEQRAAVMQTVSHEFRTPLTVIRGGVETLAGRPAAVHPSFLPVLESVERATQKLSEMVAIVLAAADAVEDSQSHGQEAVFVPDLIAEVTASLASDGHRIMPHIANGAERVVTVGTHLHLVLRELLVNALKFSPPDAPVEVRAWCDERWFRLRVRDHGDGIEPDLIPRALEPFSQLDPSTTRQHGGLGMGLFAARRLLADIDGDLELAPAPTGGLDVIVTLPQRRTTDGRGEVRLPDEERTSS